MLALSIGIACTKDDEETPDSFANNLKITEVVVGDPNTGSEFRMITFDLNWDNNWQTSSSPDNWDAVWVFIKYKVGNEEWRHATLSDNSSDHLAPSGAIINTTGDGKGVFIYSSENRNATFNAADVSLRWNYGLDNVEDDAVVNVKVFGLEMVYIPQGSFYAGDNGTMEASFTKGESDNRPWFITSEDAIEVTNTVSDGYYYTSSKDYWSEFNASEDETGTIFSIPADFPKGYRAIYCMKYELTQQQYVDFLNTLTTSQAANRYDGTKYNQYGYTILERNGIFSTSHPDRACGFLSPADGFAFADWAGLRPMSELEYEKICRGSGNPAVSGEYAWGTTYFKNAQSVQGSEEDREIISSIGANCYFWDEVTPPGPEFPLNAGIFAGDGKSRELNGAAYYGVMEMSGNLHETCVTIGNQYGRTFTFRNGNGLLSADGFADENGWPLRDGKGSGYHGGNLTINRGHMCVSLRLDTAVETDCTHRHIPWGFRGVRTVLE